MVRTRSEWQSVFSEDKTVIRTSQKTFLGDPHDTSLPLSLLTRLGVRVNGGIRIGGRVVMEMDIIRQELFHGILGYYFKYLFLGDNFSFLNLFRWLDCLLRGLRKNGNTFYYIKCFHFDFNIKIAFQSLNLFHIPVS